MKIKKSLKLGLVIILLVLICIFSVLFSTPAAWGLSFFLLALGLVDFLSFLFLPTKNQLQLELPIFLSMGEEGKGELCLNSQGIISLPIHQVQLIQAPMELSFQRQSQNFQRFGLVLRPKQRGVFSELHFTVGVTDFFNLVERRTQEQVHQQLIVLPETRKIAPTFLNQLKKMSLAKRGYERTDKLRDFRPYRAGDPLKQVDWKLSSKQDDLILREYEVSQPESPTFILWGEADADFEALVSYYFSLQAVFFVQKKIPQIILGEKIYRGEILDPIIFAELQPFKEMPQIPSLTGSVIIFAPRQTPLLESFFQKLPEKSEKKVFTLAAIKEANNG